MKQTKMSLANIQGKLSRKEMKNIMAGDNPPGGGGGGIGCSSDCKGTCTYTCGNVVYNDGNCRANSNGCFCAGYC